MQPGGRPSVLLLLALALAALAAPGFYTVDPATGFIRDAQGRARLFHGVNAVYKVPPYCPSAGAFDVEESLGPRDVAQLQALGLTVVRLGVMWPGVTPAPGAVNGTYLDALAGIVRALGDAGIATVLDCHQDLLSRQLCGEGAPDFAVSLGAGHNATFPEPVARAIPRDPATGYPDLAACLTRSFGEYYTTVDVGRAFQELYTNRTTQGFFRDYWRAVAERFRDDPNVLGFELLNEPFVGSAYDHPQVVEPGYTDRHFLQPLYDLVFDAIAAADANHLVLYEGVPVLAEVLPAGFEHGPGGAGNASRQVFAYHVYCPLVDANGVPTSPALCRDWDRRSVRQGEATGRRLGGAALITEFGAVDDSVGGGEELATVAGLADEVLHGWVYWTYKGYHDITTANTAGSETFFFPNGSLQETKVWYLSRTYAQAIAGTPVAMRYEPQGGNFSLAYNHTVADAPTVIYLNEQLHYPYGYVVALVPATAQWASPAPNRVEVTCPGCAATGPGTPVTVTIVAKQANAA